MLKRPQSAVAKLSSNIYNRVDDLVQQYDSHKYIPDSFDHTTSTLSRFNSKAPILSMADQTVIRHNIYNETILNQYNQNSQKTPQSYFDIEKQLHQASYQLKLNQVDESLENYRYALSKAVNLIPSHQFIELFGQVFKVLNARANCLIKERELKFSDLIIQTLLQWTQLQKGYEQIEFLSFIRCPLMYQAIILNTQSLHLIKIGKFSEGQGSLERALELLSSCKIEEPVHLIIGQTYLNYSSSLLYQQLYQEGMRIASTALTHLQQSQLQLEFEQDSYEITELISDAYINIAICKEKSKLFQEAHFNYYSSLVNAQKYLNKSKQNEINNVYDKFLSRQAGYLHQMTTISKKHSRYPSKTPQQPFIEIVKSLQESGNTTSNAFLKKQRLMLKEKRDFHKREQISINKFQPYSSLTKRAPSITEINPVKKSQKLRAIPKLAKIQSETEISKKGSERKVFILKNNKKTISRVPEQQIQIQVIDQDEIPPSTILRYLDNIINNQTLLLQHEVVLLEDFSDFRLSLVQSGNQYQSIMVGKLLIYLFKVKHLLYFRYNAYEQTQQDQFTQNKEYQYIIIGHSFNVSDVVNEIYSNKAQDPDKIYASFLRELISEVCGQLSVNLERQALSIQQPQNQNDGKQILFFLNETNEYVSIQSKNEYESLVFITQDPQMLTQRDDGTYEIRPLVFKEQFIRQDEEEEEEEEIQPLIAIGKFRFGQDPQLQQGSFTNQQDFRSVQQSLRPLIINEQEVQEDDSDDIQPLISVVPLGNIHDENNYMEQGENNNQSESNDYVDDFQIYDIQEEVDSQDKSATKYYPHQVYNNKVRQSDQDMREINQENKSPKNAQRQQRLSKQNSLPSQRMFGRKDQEMFTIKIESEDQISKEVIEVYADKKQNDLDVYQSMDQDMEGTSKMMQSNNRFKKSYK